MCVYIYVSIYVCTYMHVYMYIQVFKLPKLFQVLFNYITKEEFACLQY